MKGIFVAVNNAANTLVEMNKTTREWEMKAARGECGWICADCSCSFPLGMPDECQHGQQYCTDIIERDKANARKEEKWTTLKH
jgi:hypothetical protein